MPAHKPVTTALATALLILVVGGCTGGGDGDGQPSPASTTAPPPPLTVEVTVKALDVPKGMQPQAAADRAKPDLTRLLHTYLTLAFLDPGQRQKGYRDLLALFDERVRAEAQHELSSLSLSGVQGVRLVRPERATADAVVLYNGRAPGAATVRLDFSGTAEAEQGSGPVRLQAALQLMASGEGWRIAAYSTNLTEQAGPQATPSSTSSTSAGGSK